MLTPDCLPLSLLRTEHVVSTLNLKAQKGNETELYQIVQQHGYVADCHTLSCLLSSVDFSSHEREESQEDSHQGLNSSHASLSQLSHMLSLTPTQEIALGLALLHSSNPASLADTHQWLREKLPQFVQSRTLETDPPPPSTVDTSKEPETRSNHQRNTTDEASVEMLHAVLCHLVEMEQTESTTVDWRSVFRESFPRGEVPLVLSALLYPDLSIPTIAPESVTEKLPELRDLISTAMEHIDPPDGVSLSVNNSPLQDPNLIADLVEELGPTCTQSLDTMRLILAEFDQACITSTAVVQCLCLFMRTPDLTTVDSKGPLDTLTVLCATGAGALWQQDVIRRQQPLETAGSSASNVPQSQDHLDHKDPCGWNVENFLTVVLELNSSLTVMELVSAMDTEEFHVGTRAAFVLLKRFLHHASGTQSKLPVELFYKPWCHARAQLSLLIACFFYPDVLCLAYWPHRSVSSSSTSSNFRLDDEGDSHAQIWKNVDFMQALLALSEQGLYHDVYALLQQAYHFFPGVFTVTLLETKPCAMRQVMLGHTLVHYLTERTNSLKVLQATWNDPKLNETELRQQRLVLLGAVSEYIAQVTSGIREPTTCLRTDAVDSKPPASLQNALTRLVELLASVSEASDAQRVTGTLPSIVLGTTEAPSAAVSFLIHSQPAGANQTGSNMAGLKPPGHVLPTAVHVIDLSLVLLVRVADAVNSAVSRSSGAELSQSVASLQNAIRLFLLEWFAEFLRNPQMAEPFAYGIVEYMRSRYGSYVLGVGHSQPGKPASQIVALPMELRQPSSALLSRIVQSALAAVKSTSGLKTSVANLVNQALTFYLQNLSSSSTSSTTGSAAMAASSGGNSQMYRLASTTAPSSSAAASSSNFASSAKPSPINVTAAGSLSQVHQQQQQQQQQRRKTSDSAYAPPLLTVDHQPIALSFTNEPIKIEMSKEAELEAYGFFQKLLKGMSSPDDMFKTVCEYATQGSHGQRKLLDGILCMLADEVSQHLTDYPEPMLPLIADLYGSILSASTQLLPVRAISMLWRAVLTRLYSLSPDTAEQPIFRALMLILMKAKNTFTQFFNLPGCLVSCAIFKVFPPELQEYIGNAEMISNSVMRSQQAGQSKVSTSANSATHSNHLNMHQAITGPSGSSTGSPPGGLLLYAPQPDAPFKPPEPPEEAITDRVYFLFNNVSQSNAKEKSAELMDILMDESVVPWFAFYLIGKRVPVEHTFHDLFAAVLDQIQDRVPNVRPNVMQELLRNIKLLLRNMRQDRDDMQARSTLKNLGNFLGLITLARNKALLHDDLNVKDLVYEAYHKGPVPSQYVVPFVARIVRNAKESIAFRPPSPWTMGILKVFRELYDMRDVKDCLRFEIELLYQNFSLNVEDVPMAHFLRDRNHAANLELQLCFFAEMPGSSSAASTAITTAAAASTAISTEPSNLAIMPAVVSSDAAASNAPPTSSSTSYSVAQQQMLNMLAAMQKQQQQQQQHRGTSAQTSNAGTGGSSSDAANSTAMGGSGGMDMRGASGSGSSNARVLALAAAFAANQSQGKQSANGAGQPQQSSYGSLNAPTTSSSNGASGPLATVQQKQIVAAMAALQQLRSQQQQHPTSTANSSALYAIGTGSPCAGIDTSNEFPMGHQLRYDEVSIRTVRACLNLDDIISAAIACNRATGNQNALQTAVALLQSNPRLRNLIEPAITRAINELTTPVFERCARITVATVAAVVRKDFALDPDPHRMLFAARQMVRHLAAGMSLITAREALGMSLVTVLKNIILAEVQSASGQEKEAVQRLANFVVEKSMHTCLAFMQKSVAEKAVGDVEKKLEADLKLRTELGPHRFLEQATSQLASLQASMPESLRLNLGGPTPSEMLVYEEFGRVIPGFAQSAAASSAPMPSVTAGTAAGNAPVSTSAAVGQQAASPVTTAAGAQAMAYAQQQQLELSATGRVQRHLPPSTSAGGSSLRPLMSPSQFGQATNQQQQILFQQQQQQQQMQQQQTANVGILDKIVVQIERHLSFISSCLCAAADPMVRSLRGLIDAVQVAKINPDSTATVTTAATTAVIVTMVQSFLEHYRPSQWRDLPRGLEAMEHLKEAHMLILRHMLSSDQASFGYAWVTRQVTQAWIHLEGSHGPGRSTDTTSATSTTEFSQSNTARADQTGDATSKEGSTPATTMADSTAESTQRWSGWKSTDTEKVRVPSGQYNSIKWNWEAFAELLKGHVVHLSQVDAYLAQEVASGHPGAITFVIDLLDHFVLPCPNGTFVGTAAAAAALAANNYSRSSSAGATPGSVPSSSSTTSSSIQSGQTQPTTTISGGGSNSTIPAVQPSSYAAAANTPTPTAPQPKREFTVLNEYDLWLTLGVMRTRLHTIQTNASGTKLSDALLLRLRLARMRVRGLLDLGLLEQSPLFTTLSTSGNGTSVSISALYTGCSQAREFDDPPNLQEKVELLMRNWVDVYQGARQRDPATIEAMLGQLAQIGVLPNLDALTRFLRLATVFIIDRALKQLKLHDQQQFNNPSQSASAASGGSSGGGGGGGGQASVPVSSLSGSAGLSSNMSVARVAAYFELDAYARLISIIITRSSDFFPDQSNIKVLLLNKVLGIIAGTLLQEHEVRRDWFHPMPFERIFMMLFVELHSMSSPADTVDMVNGNGTTNETMTTDKANDSTRKTSATTPPPLTPQQQLPLIFCHLLHCLRPEKATAFVFSWLEMIAHRWFVGRLLASPAPPHVRAAYQAVYAQLLVDLLKFLGYFLQNALMPKSIQCLYKATLRLFLVLIHDFPEFISDYHALFCDVVPSNSIQMRNLILSAMPKRGIPSADPLQAPPVDNLASLDDPTGYCMEAGSRLPEPMRRELDAYLSMRAPVKLLSELVTMLRRADDILPPSLLSNAPQFVYHPQQQQNQARHQQALAAYAAALAFSDTMTVTSTASQGTKSDDAPEDGVNAGAAGEQAGKKLSTGESVTRDGKDHHSDQTVAETTNSDQSATSSIRPAISTASRSSAAAAALLWGMRSTQQLATFGLADEMHYNIELMTNLTLYVSITAIRNLREKGMPLNMSTIAHTPQMDIIQSLVLNLDNEGRYLLLNCMANQLRYPNSHTYYFSYTILYLFSEQSKEQVKEQISRVLMERLIVNRPHPWGLLMTSAELLRNSAYRFWEHEFARCNSEIETIVTIVARSCIPNFKIPSLTPPTTTGNTSTNVSAGSRNPLAPMLAIGTEVRQLASASGAVAPSTTSNSSSIPGTQSPNCTNAMQIPRVLNSYIPG